MYAVLGLDSYARSLNKFYHFPLWTPGDFPYQFMPRNVVSMWQVDVSAMLGFAGSPN